MDDPVELVMTDFDMIMDMDWLASYYANANCQSKKVHFQFSGEPAIELAGNFILCLTLLLAK